MVSALTLSSAKRTETAVEGVRNTLIDSNKDKKEADDRKLLRENLFSEAMNSTTGIYHELDDKRLRGTGDWILDEPLFQQWVSREAPLLWILGGPGAGKSYLSSRIIRHLKDLHPRGKQLPIPISVGFFYIKEDDQQLRSMKTILKSIAWQISENDPVFRSYAVSVCESPEKIQTAKSIWNNLFINFFASTKSKSSIFIVIDGLDEAPREERETLLELLGSQPDDGVRRPRIQIILVGRPDLHKDMQNVWEDRAIQARRDFIEVSAIKNSKDILDYITNGIGSVKILKRLPPKQRSELRDEIISKLEQGANGMFMWVKLMLEEIRNKSRPSEIRATLDSAPRDLGKMIRHVFVRVAADIDTNKSDLNETLKWVTCAERPLMLGELDLILKLNSPTEEPSYTLEDDLRGRYASFFTVTRRDGLTTEDLQRHAVEQEGPSEDEEGSTYAGDSDVEFVENNMFQSDPGDTTIQFSHASIRDYLRREGLTADTGVGVEMNDAQQHIAKTCLSIICDTEHNAKYHEPNLSAYAAANFITHLAVVDRSRVKIEDKRKIVQFLFSIFHDESTMAQWYRAISIRDFYSFVESCLINDQFSGPTRGWFEEQNCHNHLSPEDQLWAQKAAASGKEFFKPLAIFLAGRWLKVQEEDAMEDATPDALNAVSFLKAYLSINEDGNRKDISVVEKSIERVAEFLPTERIRALAKFCDFEEDSHWHCRLANYLALSHLEEDAIGEFDISIRMDDRNWRAMYGMGVALKARNNYPAAIEWLLKALRFVPENQARIRTISWDYISSCRRTLGDIEGAIRASNEACLENPNDIDAARNHIISLHAGSRSEEIIAFAKKLDKDRPKNGRESNLIKVLLRWGVHEQIANAARAVGRLEFAIQAFEAAVEAAKQYVDECYVEAQWYQLANLWFRHGKEETRALRMWEYLFENIRDKHDTRMWGDRDIPELCSDSLSQLYFTRAVAAEKNGGDPGVWISKLESLEKQRRDDKGDDKNDRFNNKPGIVRVYGRRTMGPSLILGLWYRLHGKRDEAMACFKAKIVEAILELKNEEVFLGAVEQAYQNLSETLLMAGDKTNAAAASAAVFALLDKVKAGRNAGKQATKMRRRDVNEENATEDEKEVAEHNTAVTGMIPTESVGSNELQAIANPTEAPEASEHEGDSIPTETDTNPDGEVFEYDVRESTTFKMWKCDGDCRHNLEEMAEVYVCETCLSTYFCDECVELVRTKALPFRKCDAEHTFYRAYPVPDKLEEIATVGVYERIQPRMEWVEGLEKEWAGE
jgi:tetratricopeptide (TPR) repeat protein/Cdc6-like AAA superfamily ATPase